MGKELEFWLDVLKESKKQFVMARGAYKAVCANILEKKQRIICANLQAKAIAIPGGGTLQPIRVNVYVDDYRFIYDDLYLNISVHAIRPVEELESLSGLTTKEIELIDKYKPICTEIMQGMSFNRMCQEKDCQNLRDIQEKLVCLKNRILLYDEFKWTYRTESIFSDSFFSPNLNIKDTRNILFERHRFGKE